MKKIIAIVLALMVVIGLVIWKFGPSLISPSKTQNGPINITYWGLWEDAALIQPLIDEYQQTHPNVKIVYEKKNSNQYRSRVEAQIKEGTGPDVFRMHNTWLPMFTAYLSPAPKDIFTLTEYENTFFEVSKKSFVRGEFITAAPMGIDGLALFVNEDILQGAGVGVPTNWQDFTNSAIKMTVRDENGTIKTAGAALGSPANVDHWSDILGVLMLQQGIKIEEMDPVATSEVLRFFTGFITDTDRKTWDASLPASTQAFAQGRLAFYIGPSWRAHELRQINPSLNFKIAPVPQLPGRTPVAWASFWGEAVSNKSKNPKAAWEFVKYLTSKETQKKLYESASKVRLFGEPYSNKELAAEVATDPLVGAFVTQGDYYDYWYMSSNTFDQGINDQNIKYFEDGVNSILQGTSADTAVGTISKGVAQIYERYFPAPAASAQ